LHGARICVPLLADGTVIGALVLVWARDRAIPEADRAFIVSLANQAAQALDRARLQQGRKAALERAETALALAQAAVHRTTGLQQLTAELSAAVTVDAVTDVVARVGAAMTEAASGIVMLLTADGQALEMQEQYGLPAAVGRAWQRVPLSLPTVATEAVRSVAPVVVLSQADLEARFPAILGRQSGPYRSRAAYPMVVDGRAIGCICFGWTDWRPVSDEDRQFGMAVAALAAQAFERARLYLEAQESLQMRDEFLSMASHELRTPLTSLKLQLDSLLKKAEAVPAAQMPHQALLPKLQRLDRQLGRLSKLVVELLDVARAAQGRLPFEFEPVDLRQVVREVADRYADEISRQGCALWLQCAPAVGDWDRSRLDQVVTNLLSNALKYGAGKPITVTTAVEGDEAVLTVKDQGIGIAAENHERVFERFERVVSIRNYGGFGLGLWIVREIVQAFGGRIAVDSRQDEGAAFIVRLPLRPVTPGTGAEPG
jgi:signal transduction histidine kinase